jgi:predicted permease
VTAVAVVRSLTQPPAPGLEPDGVLMATVSLPRPQYSADQTIQFFARLLAGAESIPQVTAASVVETIPVANNRPLDSVEMTTDVRADQSSPRTQLPRVLGNRVSRGHFQTLGIPLLQGRDFNAQDEGRATSVAIVNETLARLWPGESSVGRRLRLGSEWVTVVGVARDSKYASVTEEPRPFVYRPLGQGRSGFFEGTLLVKTNGDTRSAVPLIRSLVADLDPNLAVYNLNTLEDRLALSLLPNRAIAITSGLLGVVALLLGAVGTYSVIAFLVVQRRREIGVRLALGALPSTVVRMIAGQGARWIATGLAIGALGGFGVLRLLQGVLVGVSVQDPLPIVTVLLLLGATGGLASWVPARAAGKADPLAILRQ